MVDVRKEPSHSLLMTTAEQTKALEIEYRANARREQMIRELASDLADLVASGDMTEIEANDWMASKQEQWKDGLN